MFNDVRLTNTKTKEELGKKDIAEDVTSQERTTRQLRDLCQQHQIPMSRLVENIIECNRAELELGELRSRGILTKGKNKRELVDLCKANDVACTKTVEKFRMVGWEKQRGYYKCCGSKAKLTAQGSSSTHLPERTTNLELLLNTVLVA